MSLNTRNEMLPRLRQRYVGRGRQGRSQLIDEVCEQFRYSRKHAIKLLNAKAGWGGRVGAKRGRPPVYREEVSQVVGAIWMLAEQPCGKRLKALLPQWLPYYEAEQGVLGLRLRREVLSASAATLDRILAPMRVQHPHRGRCGTRPGSLLKTQIPIRTDNWDVNQPGYLEADTVAHCGESMAGNFIWSVTYTDIYSGWTASRAVWNRGAEEVVQRTREVETGLPFGLKGFDCDNGGEFLNHHLLRYFAQRPQRVEFTRSRPYHKDDNGHVEQKNWTHVRQLLGYDRLEDPRLLEPINEVYRRFWDPLRNFFLPSSKLINKHRHGAQLVRRHDQPQTPCDRLLASPHVDAPTKQKLRSQRQSLNPFELKRALERALRPILLRGLRASRPAPAAPRDSLHSARETAKPSIVPVSSL